MPPNQAVTASCPAAAHQEAGSQRLLSTPAMASGARDVHTDSGPPLRRTHIQPMLCCGHLEVLYNF